MEENKLLKLVKKAIITSNSGMTLGQIQKEVFHQAIKELTGKTSFQVKDIIDAINQLIEDGEIEKQKKETEINIFVSKE